MSDEDRALRDKIIRMEAQLEQLARDFTAMDRKIWAAIALVLLAVGNRLINLIGLGQ